MDGQYWKGDRTMSTNEWLLTSDFWQFLEPWHGRWYEYEIFIASCTDNIYDLENERWLLGDMIDHVGIYGSRVAEGLSAFNGGLVLTWNQRVPIWIDRIGNHGAAGGSQNAGVLVALVDTQSAERWDMVSTFIVIWSKVGYMKLLIANEMYYVMWVGDTQNIIIL